MQNPAPVRVVIRPTTPFALWMAATAHFFIGLSFAVEPSATAYNVLLGLLGLGLPFELHESLLTVFSIEPPNPTQTFGIGLMLISVLASISLLFERQMPRLIILACILPQWATLMLGALFDIWVFLSGDYHDREISRWFVMGATSMFVSLTFFHNWNILERYFFQWPRH